MTCETEAFIRKCAEAKWSKEKTRAALGIGRPSFNDILKLLPAMPWVGSGRRGCPSLRAGSVSQSAAQAGIPRSTVQRRIRNGMTLEQALAVPKREIVGSCATEQFIRQCAADGKSKRQTAIELGLNIKKLQQLLLVMPPLEWRFTRRNVDMQALCERAAEVNKARAVITVLGVTGCMRDLCKHFNLPYSTFNERRALGMSVEEALRMPRRRRGWQKQAAAQSRATA